MDCRWPGNEDAGRTWSGGGTHKNGKRRWGNEMRDYVKFQIVFCHFHSVRSAVVLWHFPVRFCFAPHCRLVIVCRVPLSGKRISVCRTYTQNGALCSDSFATWLTIFKACPAIGLLASSTRALVCISNSLIVKPEIIWHYSSPRISS